MSKKTKVGILGTGNAAQTLGRAWRDVGHDILLGSRRADAFKEFSLPVESFLRAVTHGEVIVNALSGQVTIDVLRNIGAPALAGKILIDVSVALTEEFDSVVFQKESGAELVQNEFPGMRVVKSLCTMTSDIMVNPQLLSDTSTVFLSGNDQEAKSVTAGLLEDLGWDRASQLDLGGIETARGQEHFAMLYFALTSALGSDKFNIKVVTQQS